jgi:hypothetical protein
MRFGWSLPWLASKKAMVCPTCGVAVRVPVVRRKG